MAPTDKPRPFMYGLSTCGWCAKAKAWLDSNVDAYDLVYVDLLDEQERDRMIDELSHKVDRIAFPLIIFGETCVVGFKPDEYATLAGK